MPKEFQKKILLRSCFRRFCMEFYIERFRTELRLFDDNSDLEIYSNWWMPFLKSSRAVILNKNGDKLYSIKRNFLLSKFKLVYEIHRANGFKYILDLTRKGTIYEIKIDDNFYEIKIHKQRKSSIFKNKIQIALIDEAFMSLLGKNKIKVLANNDVNKEIVFLLITCLNIGNENESEMSFDFGNIGKVEALDNNWKPN